jgi:hypothetical protein
MRAHLKWLAGLAAIGVSVAAHAGSWKYGQDPRGHDELTYNEDGKIIFYMGCGHAFGLHARYPGKPAKNGKASITIANARTNITFKGEFEEPDEDMATEFVQFDLGYRRQDLALYGKRWKAEAARLYDLLGSGQPLTISAGKDHYPLPPVDAANWREPFNGCG